MKERVETDRHKETDKHTQTHRRKVRDTDTNTRRDYQYWFKSGYDMKRNAEQIQWPGSPSHPADLGWHFVFLLSLSHQW